MFNESKFFSFLENDFIPKCKFIMLEDAAKLQCYTDIAIRTQNMKEKDFYLSKIQEIVGKIK